MTSIEFKPAIHLLGGVNGSSFTHRVVVTLAEGESVEDGTWVGSVRAELAGHDAGGAPYYNYVPITRTGLSSNHSITREGAAEWLVEHWLTQRQDVYLVVRVTVDPEMWDLSYGEHGTLGDRAEDVRSYVSDIFSETSQSRPGGEGGIYELDVDLY